MGNRVDAEIPSDAYGICVILMILALIAIYLFV